MIWVCTLSWETPGRRIFESNSLRVASWSTLRGRLLMEPDVSLSVRTVVSYATMKHSFLNHFISFSLVLLGTSKNKVICSNIRTHLMEDYFEQSFLRIRSIYLQPLFLRPIF